MQTPAVLKCSRCEVGWGRRLGKTPFLGLPRRRASSLRRRFLHFSACLFVFMSPEVLHDSYLRTERNPTSE